MKIALEKGRNALKFEIPDNRILDVITGDELPALDHGLISKIIDKGIKENAPADIAKKKVAIIIPDDTRLWARGDIFVPVIVKALTDLGLAFEQIKIIIALGTHDDISSEKFDSLAGRFCAQNVTILNSANKDRDRLVYIGDTPRGTRLLVTREAWEADHIIIFGGILHHLIAGFGGGRKYILPGICGHESIMQNHSLAIDKEGQHHPLVGQARVDDNPVSQDMEDGAALFLKHKSSCYAAIAANGSGQIFHAQAGELSSTFRQSCQKLNQACCAAIPEQGDFALISAGGYKTDSQLYQATKALFNAAGAVKPGGQILFVAECALKEGNPGFAKMLKEFKNFPQDIGRSLVSCFDMPSYVAFRLIDILNRFCVTLVSDFDENQTRKLGFEYTQDIDFYVKNLTGRGYVIPFAENILPIIR